MPRRNKRKDYSTGKGATFYTGGNNTAPKPECVGCAFAGKGYVCKTSDGSCLLTAKSPDEQANTQHQQPVRPTEAAVIF
jgi:hypothetical protein